MSTAAPLVAAEVSACLTKVSPSTRKSSEPAKSPSMSIRIEGMLEYHDVSCCKMSSLSTVVVSSSSCEPVEAMLVMVASSEVMQRSWGQGVVDSASLE